MTWFLVSTSLLFVDWRQSVFIAKHPDRYTETNFFSARHPTETSINRWFAGAAVVNAAIGFSLPKKYKDTYFKGVSIVQVSFVATNYSIGIKMDL